MKDQRRKLRGHMSLHRLCARGGTPTTKPTDILVGKTLKEMIERDIKDEDKRNKPVQRNNRASPQRKRRGRTP